MYPLALKFCDFIEILFLKTYQKFLAQNIKWSQKILEKN